MDCNRFSNSELCHQLLHPITLIGAGLALAFAWLFIEDPKGQIAEEMPDGSIALIDVT